MSLFSRIPYQIILISFTFLVPCKNAIASYPTLELRECDFREICTFAMVNDERIVTELADPELRQAHDLPLGSNLTEGQRDLYESLKQSRLYELCLEQNTWEPGVIIAALNSMNLMDMPEDNPYLPTHEKPNCDPAIIRAGRELIHKNIQRIKQHVLADPRLKSVALNNRTEMAKEMIASELIILMEREMALDVDHARQIFMYLQAKYHWRPEEYEDSSEDNHIDEHSSHVTSFENGQIQDIGSQDFSGIPSINTSVTTIEILEKREPNRSNQGVSETPNQRFSKTRNKRNGILVAGTFAGACLMAFLYSRHNDD